MAYQALYRKYRPASFQEVVGQKHIVQTLKNAVQRDRIAHAYLFCGPRGTGKTSIAKIFAKMLNCTTSPLDPCGKCENCRMAQEGSHPDIIEIDAASNNGVDEVRNLIDKVKYAPMQGKYKVYIIDEVHMMTTGAFNALLKTIEEPPAHVVFILATTEPQKVLPTIISRCQRYDFNSVSQSEIQSRLLDVCEKEGIQIEPQAASLIASLAQGGMRDALSILDQCVAYAPDTVTIADVRDVYGVVTQSDIGQIFSDIHKRVLDPVMEKLASIENAGLDLKRFTADFIQLLKDSIILEHSPESSLVSEETRQIIQTYFLPASVYMRMDLLKELMEVYSKYGYASSVLDYLESAILQIFLRSYDRPAQTWNPASENMQQMEMSVKHSDPQGVKHSDHVFYSHENSSDHSDISSKTAEIAKNKPSQDTQNISDVSRETFSQSDSVSHPDLNPVRKEELSDDFILGLMKGANKEIRKKDQESFEKINEFGRDLEFGRFANALRDCQIMAASENYILVSTKRAMSAQHINNMGCYELESFMEKLLGQRKKVFAILERDGRRLTKQFIQRNKSGDLPPVPEVKLEDANSMQSITQSDLPIEQQLQELFGQVDVFQD